MYYAYLDTPVGTELIGSAKDRETAEIIKAKKRQTVNQVLCGVLE